MLGVNTGTRAKEEGVYLSLAGAFLQECKITDWEKRRDQLHYLNLNCSFHLSLLPNLGNLISVS